MFKTTFGIFIDVKKSHFDNNFFYQYFYNSKIYGLLSKYFYKIFFQKKIYIGRHLYSCQWGENKKKQSFIKILSNYISSENEIGYLEIGSYAGGSIITASQLFLEQNKNYKSYSIDLHDKIYNQKDILKSHFYSDIEKISTLGEVKALFVHNIKYSNLNINYYQGDINNFILNYLKDIKSTINIFYIDASHYYYDVKNDINKCYEIINFLKPKKALLFGDDYNLDYKIVEKEYNESYLFTDTIRSKITGTTFHPGVTKAVHDSFEEFGSENGLWYKILNQAN